MQIAELIDGKISEGIAILQELGEMRKRSGAAMNVVYYVNEDVDRCRKRISLWQLTSRERLISAFGESHRYVLEFSDTISGKNYGFNYKHEFESEVNQGLTILESVSETLKLDIDISSPSKPESKPPMVFISHSSNDREFAEALVVMLEDIGFDSSNLFCSSVDGYGVGISQDIFTVLRKLFVERELYVIFIHSPRYYESPVSLNEMGAAWVLKTDFCSFLTNDMEFGMMKGVVDGGSIAIKIDAEGASSRLNELKEKLIQTFNLPQVNGTKWERKRQAFLDKVQKLKCQP